MKQSPLLRKPQEVLLDKLKVAERAGSGQPFLTEPPELQPGDVLKILEPFGDDTAPELIVDSITTKKDPDGVPKTHIAVHLRPRKLAELPEPLTLEFTAERDEGATKALAIVLGGIATDQVSSPEFNLAKLEVYGPPGVVALVCMQAREPSSMFCARPADSNITA